VKWAWGKLTPAFSADGASLVGVGAPPSDVILFGCIACGSRPRIRDRDGALRLTCGTPACVRMQKLGVHPNSIQGRARGGDLKEIRRRRAEYVQNNKTLIRGLESNPLA
jgi:hypothetical protein